jgi:hypothetical protein
MLSKTYIFNENTDLGQHDSPRFNCILYEYILYYQDKDVGTLENFAFLTYDNIQTEIVPEDDLLILLKNRYTTSKPFEKLLSISGVDIDRDYIPLFDIINKLFYYNDIIYWDDIFRICDKILNINLITITYYIDDIDPFEPIIIKRENSHSKFSIKDRLC